MKLVLYGDGKTTLPLPLSLCGSCRIGYNVFFRFFSLFILCTSTFLVNEAENDPVPEMVAQLSQEVYNTDVLIPLVQQLGKLEFEVFSLFILLYFRNIFLQ